MTSFQSTLQVCVDVKSRPHKRLSEHKEKFDAGINFLRQTGIAAATKLSPLYHKISEFSYSIVGLGIKKKCLNFLQALHTIRLSTISSHTQAFEALVQLTLKKAQIQSSLLHSRKLLNVESSDDSTYITKKLTGNSSDTLSDCPESGEQISQYYLPESAPKSQFSKVASTSTEEIFSDPPSFALSSEELERLFGSAKRTSETTDPNVTLPLLERPFSKRESEIAPLNGCSLDDPLDLFLEKIEKRKIVDFPESHHTFHCYPYPALIDPIYAEREWRNIFSDYSAQLQRPTAQVQYTEGNLYPNNPWDAREVIYKAPNPLENICAYDPCMYLPPKTVSTLDSATPQDYARPCHSNEGTHELNMLVVSST